MIDWNRLRALNNDFGAEAMGEVVAVFVAEMDDAVDQLPAITDTGARADALHTLKGTAANLGLVALADFCAEAEGTLRRDGPPQEFGGVVQRVQTVYASSRAELLHGLPDRLGLSVQP